MDHSNKILIRTLVVSGLSVILSYLINFLLTPYITETIGTDAYGFVTLAKSFVSYASILTVALTAFIVRYITLSYHQRDYRQSSGYFSSALAAVILLSVGILVIASIAICNLEKWLKVPQNILGQVKLLFFMVFINFSITTVTVPYTAACYIKNKLSTYNWIKILSYVAEAISMILLFSLFGTKIWYVGIALTVASTTILLLNCYLTAKETPEIQFKVKFISLQKVKELVQNGIWQSVNSIGTTLNSGLDLLITNQLLSSLAMGQLSIAKTIGLMFSVLYSTISQSFQPRMLRAYANEDLPKLQSEIRLSMRVSGFFSGCGFAGFLALGMLYYKLWIPNENTQFVFYLTVITILSSIAEGVVYPTYYVNTLTMKKMVPSLVTIFTGLTNVFAMYVLIKYCNAGVHAVIWTTAVLSFLTGFLFNAIYCPITLGLPWYTLYPVILRHCLGCGLMCIVFKGIVAIMNPRGWIGLILTALCCVAVGVIVYTLSVTTWAERNMIKEKIRKGVVHRG